MKRINTKYDKPFTIFESAFRPFFILAAAASLFYMTVWTLYYAVNLPLTFQNTTPSLWHAHEMLFGYTMAVIAGFILTAEKYWLGKNIDNKLILYALIILWILARVILFIQLVTNIPYEIGAVFDCLFMILLAIRVGYPIIRAQAWDKCIIALHIALLAAANIVFYLGIADVIANGANLGVYSALYIVVSLIVLMGRRMIPIFVRNALKFKFEPKNWRLVDALSIVIFVLFFVTEIFSTYDHIAAILCGLLLLTYSIRIYGWYSPKIWDKPLLWVLFVGYSWIAIGFGLKFFGMFFSISNFLSLHSFTYGGIGIMTIGFMSRVILGHTGRDVFHPPKIVFWIFSIVFAGAIIRILFPLFNMNNYLLWISISQILWVLSFLIFAITFLPMLISPRLPDEA